MATSPVRRRLAPCVIAALLALGCDGSILDPAGSDGPGGGLGGGGGGPGGTSGGLGEPSFHFRMTEPSGFPAVRMMTRDELARTITDLAGVRPDTGALPAELVVLNLSNDASQVRVQDARHMRQLLELATQVSADADIGAVVSCAADPCAGDEIGAFLERAFADHASPAEVSTYAGIYDGARAEGTHDFARRAVLQASLLSPRFLYRTELGDRTGRLTATELAKKLSYFLWGTRPDEALLSAALDGSLLGDAVYRTQVDRLLADERARQRFVQILFQWLGLDHLDLGTKSLAPELPEGIQADMEREVELLALTVLFDDGGSLADLFRSQTTFVNERLAALYGIEGVTGAELQRVSLEGTERRGILTTALVLAAHSKEDGRSPMQRGKFLVDEVMCHSFPPEAGIAVMELPGGDFESFRDRFRPLETTAPCSNCHRVLNAGFAFDIFDNVGRRWALPQVPSTEAAGHFDLPPHDVLRFDTTVEAVEGFAQHPALGPCFVAQTYRFAMGRIPGAEDADAFAELARGFAEGGQDVPALLRAVALSHRFRTPVTSP